MSLASRRPASPAQIAAIKQRAAILSVMATILLTAAKLVGAIISGSLAHGVEASQAETIFDLLAKFADYGFNKSHAAAYALVAYQTAYLKANFPVEFLAASMTLDMGNTDKLAEFRAEAGRLGIAVVPPEKAIEWSLSGPMLRGSGINYDIRKAMPYSSYDHFEFDVPTGQNGDVYDRYKVRIEEMRQSLRIIEQAINNLPGGPYRSENRKYVPPPRSEIGHSMESLIHHFKLWTEGYRLPKGEVYVRTESPRGELGVYLVSDGGTKPWRVRFRTPTFWNLQSISWMAQGHLVADLVAIIGTLDVVLGDCDR